MTTPTGHRPAVFLDRDGVLNIERGDYTFQVADFEICPGAPEALRLLKQAGYLLVVVTNQGGIAKALYTRAQMEACHKKLQEHTGHIIDAIYYSPDHPQVSASLSRKPGSLMLEKAAVKFGIDYSVSFIIGDRNRDIEAGVALGVKGIIIGEEQSPGAIYRCHSLLEAAEWLLQKWPLGKS